MHLNKTLILFLSSLGLLLFGSTGYGIYITVGPSSNKLRDTIQEHVRMNELGIAHGHNGHIHNETEYIHWDIKWIYIFWFRINNAIPFYFNSLRIIIVLLYLSSVLVDQLKCPAYKTVELLLDISEI